MFLITELSKRFTELSKRLKIARINEKAKLNAIKVRNIYLNRIKSNLFYKKQIKQTKIIE